MPPAIVVAVIAVGASAAGAIGVISLTTAFVIATAATVGGALLTKTETPSLSGNSSQQERKQVLRAAAAAQTLIYGRTVTSGVLFFAEEQAGNQDKGEWVHLAIALCGHPIDGVETIWLGDDAIGTFPASNVTYEVHSGRTTPDPFMLANCPSWKDDMIGRGITWLRVSLKFDQDLFPAGIPNIKVQLRGKRVYDPRDGVTRWSESVPLIVRDYLSTICDVLPEDLDDNSFIQAANISAELVTTTDGSEPRYRMAGIIDVSDARSSVLDDMCLACAGEMTYIGGKHGMLVGAYYGPATMNLTADQIISDVDIVPESSYADKINTVTGVFVDPKQGYIDADFPAVRVAQFIEDDGAEYAEDLKLKFVISEFQAQRLAQIKINRKRLGRTLKFKCNMFAYRYRPGYYVKLSIPPIGITAQEFRISTWSLDAKGGVDLTMRQETPAVWLDAIGTPIDRPDLTDLPTSAVAAPYNLNYQVLEIGEVVQGVLSWSNAGPVAYNNVFIRQNGAIVFTAQVPGQSLRLSGLVRGQYQAGVVAISPMGVASPEASLIFSIAAPSAPTRVDIQQSYFSITLIPATSDINAVNTQFDFWWSGETNLPSTDTAYIEANATRLGLAKTWTQNQLKADHTYYFYVRAVNPFGSSAFLKVQATCNFTGAEMIDYIDKGIKQSETYKILQAGLEETYEAAIENALANEGEYFRQSKEINVMDVRLSASITETQTLIVNNDKAYSEKFTQLNSTIVDVNNKFGPVSATVQELSSTYADLNGKLSAQWGAKVQVASNGTKYFAGIQLGIEGNGGAVQSYFLVTADTFGFYNPNTGGTDLAFAITNGQTFIREAMIPYASITLARIGSWYSANYVSGVRGTIMRADGSFELLGGSGRSGGTVINDSGIAIYDAGGVERFKAGRLN